MRIKKILFGYFFLAILSGIALAIWRTVLIVRYYDPYSNEYALEAEPSLRSLAFTIVAVLVILATSAILLHRFEFGNFSAAGDQFSVFTSSLLGFVLLAIGIFIFFRLDGIMGMHGNPFYKYAQLATHILIFCCALYFVLNAAGNPRFENARRVLAVVTPVWGVAFLISSYLDPAYNYMNYDHNLCLVAICALTLFLLYDAGMTVTGKPSTAYFVFSLLSLVTSMAYMLPTFVLMAYWELTSEVNHIFEASLLATIFYTCACLRNLCLSVKVREKTELKKKSKKAEKAS